MFYYLFYPLREWFFGFNVFRYISFRAAMASLTAFIFTLVLAPFVIRSFKTLKLGQSVRKREEVRELYDLRSSTDSGIAKHRSVQPIAHPA